MSPWKHWNSSDDSQSKLLVLFHLLASRPRAGPASNTVLERQGAPIQPPFRAGLFLDVALLPTLTDFKYGDSYASGKKRSTQGDQPLTWRLHNSPKSA